MVKIIKVKVPYLDIFETVALKYFEVSMSMEIYKKLFATHVQSAGYPMYLKFFDSQGNSEICHVYKKPDIYSGVMHLKAGNKIPSEDWTMKDSNMIYANLKFRFSFLTQDLWIVKCKKYPGVVKQVKVS